MMSQSENGGKKRAPIRALCRVCGKIGQLRGSTWKHDSDWRGISVMGHDFSALKESEAEERRKVWG